MSYPLVIQEMSKPYGLFKIKMYTIVLYQLHEWLLIWFPKWFLLYELSPGQSVGEQVIWPVQNYYLHHCTFPKLYLVSMDTIYVNNCIKDYIKWFFQYWLHEWLHKWCRKWFFPVPITWMIAYMIPKTIFSCMRYHLVNQ